MIVARQWYPNPSEGWSYGQDPVRDYCRLDSSRISGLLAVLLPNGVSQEERINWVQVIEQSSYLEEFFEL